MEAIVLAGGKAERMGDATEGRPKSLVQVGGKPLLAWQVGRLQQAGVERVIVSCAAGQEPEFEPALDGLGVEIACAGEPERLGRGGAIRFAACSAARTETFSRSTATSSSTSTSRDCSIGTAPPEPPRPSRSPSRRRSSARSTSPTTTS